jgi:hypothetical protein
VALDRGGKLGISFSHTKKLTGDLEHWQYDTFVARRRDPTLAARAYVTFRLGPDGKVEQPKMQALSADGFQLRLSGSGFAAGAVTGGGYLR